jgi:pimeloyl-ACP methyl ester carboxylesterase
LKTIDFCVESYGQRDLWGTLTVPEQITGWPIVMAHGALGFKDWAFFPHVSQVFAEAGFPVVRFNFSGSGMGPQIDGPFEDLEAFRQDTITKQVEDLRSIIQCLAQGKFEPDLGPLDKVFLWGHSRGSAVCFLAAANSPQVQGIAAWSTIARVNRYLYEMKNTWRHQGFYEFPSSRTGQTLAYSTAFLDDVENWGKQGDVPTFLHHLKVPVLLVHGMEDTSVPPDESESLAAIYPKAKLVLVAGGDHKFNSTHPFTQPSGALSLTLEKT